MSKGPQGMKIALPPEMYGGNPAGLIEYLGLTMERRPTNPADVWEGSLGTRRQFVSAPDQPTYRL